MEKCLKMQTLKFHCEKEKDCLVKGQAALSITLHWKPNQINNIDENVYITTMSLPAPSLSKETNPYRSNITVTVFYQCSRSKNTVRNQIYEKLKAHKNLHVND